MCKPYYDHKKINSNNNLQLTGFCQDGCQNASSVEFEYLVYHNTGTDIEREFTTNIYSSTSSFFKGSFDSEEFSIISDLFSNMSAVNFFKVSLRITIDHDLNKTGESSIIFRLNKLPRNGQCSIDIDNGFAMRTFFKIKCINWVDDDGDVTRFEYLGTALLFLIEIYKISEKYTLTGSTIKFFI